MESELSTPAQQWSVLRILSADELAAAAEERALAGRCGNPRCPNPPGGVHLVAGVRAGSSGGVDGITCSRACLLEIKKLGEKLGDSGAAQARFDALVEKVKLRRQREREEKQGGAVGAEAGAAAGAGQGVPSVRSQSSLAAGTPAVPILKEKVIEHAPRTVRGKPEASGDKGGNPIVSASSRDLPAPGSKEALQAAQTVEGYVVAHRPSSKRPAAQGVGTARAEAETAGAAATPLATAAVEPRPLLPAQAGSGGVRFADEVPGGSLDDGGNKGSARAEAVAGGAAVPSFRTSSGSEVGREATLGVRAAEEAMRQLAIDGETHDTCRKDAGMEGKRPTTEDRRETGPIDGAEAGADRDACSALPPHSATLSLPSSTSSASSLPPSASTFSSAPLPSSLHSLLGDCTREEALAATSAAAPPAAAEMTAAQTEALLRAAAARRGLTVLNPRMEAALPKDIDEKIEAQLRAAGLGAARGSARRASRDGEGAREGTNERRGKSSGADGRRASPSSSPSSSDDEEHVPIPASERWREDEDDDEAMEDENDDPWYSTDEESESEAVLEDGGPPDPLDGSADGAGHAPPGGSRFRVKMTLFGSSFTFFENWCTPETRQLVAGAESDCESEERDDDDDAGATFGGNDDGNQGVVQKRIRDRSAKANKGKDTEEKGRDRAGSAVDEKSSASPSRGGETAEVGAPAGASAATPAAALSSSIVPASSGSASEAASFVDPPSLAPLREAAAAALLSGLADARQAGALSRAPLGALRAALLDFCGTLRPRTALPPLRARQWRLPALVALKAMSLDAAPGVRPDFEDRHGLRETYRVLEEIGVTDEEFDALLDLVVHGEEW